jgi:hypothetical protein
MKVIIALIFLILLSFGKSTAQTPDWEWAVQSGDPEPQWGNVIPTAMAIDPRGNIYILGEFDDVAMFGDSVFHGSHGNGGFGTTNIFLVKYNPEGKVVWAKNPQGLVQEGSWIAIDSSGLIYIAGFADSIVDFGNGFKSDTGAFIAQYDSSGATLWGKQIGLTNKTTNSLYSNLDISMIAIGNRNNLYVIGYLYDSLKIDGMNIKKDSNSPFVIIQFDSKGKAQWLKQEIIRGGNLKYNFAVSSFAVTNDDENFTFYIAGLLTADSAYFDEHPFSTFGVQAPVEQIFLAQYNRNGCQWVQNVDRHQNFISGPYYPDLTVSNGSIYLSTTFAIDSLNYSDLQYKNEAFQHYDFVAKYRNDGSVQWIKKIWSTVETLYYNNDQCGAVMVDPDGYTYLSGIFNTQIDFGNEIINPNSTARYPRDLFAAKFDKDGKTLWVQQSGRANGSAVNVLQAYHNGHPYLCGYFDEALTLGKFQLSRRNNSQHTLYLAKLGNTPSSIKSSGQISNNTISLSPNPASSVMTVTFNLSKPANISIEIYDFLGRKITDVSLGLFTEGEHSESLDLHVLPSGTYLCKTSADKKMFSSIVFTVVK